MTWAEVGRFRWEQLGLLTWEEIGTLSVAEALEVIRQREVRNGGRSQAGGGDPPSSGR